MVAKYFIRFLFILFWGVIIYGFLLIPYLEPWFSSTNKYLCIYTWADRIDESILQKFEQKTGIKIYVNHYESNEELLTKLEHMPFVDCDLILPSGYIIDSMVQAGLIKKIDYKKCNFISRIYPYFLKTNIYQHEYALALYWDVLGIGFNNKRLQANQATLKTIFCLDSFESNYKIGMIDDARQSIILSSFYLGYPFENLSKEQLVSIGNLLYQQREIVGAYSDTQQGYYLASETFDMVVSEREHICRQMQNHDFISFVIPEQGSLLSIDYLVVSASSKKDDLIYEFIDYLFSYEICKYHCETFCLMPTCKDVFDSLDQKYIGVKDLNFESLLFKKLQLSRTVLTSKEINDFWINLKAL
ncbi:extracellular solute-binding protein [Candidatus Dependentiae bacterium]|nr:extracellular solute-binding protein [Candidatus Dependentiae bacterium]